MAGDFFHLGKPHLLGHLHLFHRLIPLDSACATATNNEVIGNWSFYSKNETTQFYFLKNKSENKSLKSPIGCQWVSRFRQQTANMFQMILGLASTATICHKWAAKRATPYSTPTEKKETGWWFQAIWKIWKSVVHLIPNIWKHKTCLKPPTRKK